MIEQYRKDVSQIHASSELIQRTRAAMKQEEERLQEEEEVPGRRKSMKWDLVRYGAGRIAIPLVAAAAALLLVIAPGVIQRSIPQADTKIQMPGKLGQKGENYPVILKNGDNQTIELTETAKMPAEFADAEKIEMNGAVYYVLPGEASCEWKAYVEMEGRNYLLCGRAEEEEDFLNRAEALLLKQ